MYVVASAAIAIAPVAATSGTVSQAATHATHAVKHVSMNQHMHINCSTAAAMCTEVAKSDDVFGHYVGHDEPSLAFYSHNAGSGNRMSYNVTLPTEPPASNPNNVNKAFSFELSGADWFGMAMCDTQSFPELKSTLHAGQRQQHPQPGDQPPARRAPPSWRCSSIRRAGSSGRPGGRPWKRQFLRPHPLVRAALNIDSLSLNPVTNQANNGKLPGQGR